MWGFLTPYQNDQIFHFWELSRKPSLANCGIARQLIDCAKQQLHLYPEVKFATLNVEKLNIHAKEIYSNEHFQLLNEVKQKQFMVNSLTSNSSIELDSEVSKNLVKKFVIKSVPLYKLAYYELIRQCELLWRACWYR